MLAAFVIVEQLLGVPTGAVVMVPNDMDRFSQLEGVVRAVVGEHFDVRDTEMCVWQHLTLQVLQNQIFVCFVVDLIKQLR